MFKLVGKTISRGIVKAVDKGENLVIGKPPGRTSSSSSSGPKRSLSGKGSKNRKMRHEDEQDFDLVHLFCSDMYSSEFVVNAAKEVEANTTVTRLVLEDLIQRNDEPISEMIMDLIANNFFSSVKKSSAGRNSSKRIWTAIVFIDCISDAESYNNYLNLKQSFTSFMKERLSNKGMTKDLPITFEAKIALHTMLDVYGVIQLLEAVNRDNSVKSVKFTGFRGEDKEIADAFSQIADVESMEWKENVEILVKYRRHVPKKDNHEATKLVNDCVLALQNMVFSASVADFDHSFNECSGKLTLATNNPSVHKPGMEDESETEASLFESSHSVRVRALGP